MIRLTPFGVCSVPSGTFLAACLVVAAVFFAVGSSCATEPVSGGFLGDDAVEMLLGSAPERVFAPSVAVDAGESFARRVSELDYLLDEFDETEIESEVSSETISVSGFEESDIILAEDMLELSGELVEIEQW